MILKFILIFMVVILAGFNTGPSGIHADEVVEEDNDIEEVVEDDNDIVEEEDNDIVEEEGFTIDFETVMYFINIGFLVAITAFSIYFRFEAVVNKFLARDKEAENQDLKSQLLEQKEEFSVIISSLITLGNTLNVIVQASKLPEASKISISENWVKTKTKIEQFMEAKHERIEKFKETLKEYKEEFMQVFEPAKDIISKYVSSDDEEHTE